jgi:hypothetical protein
VTLARLSAAVVAKIEDVKSYETDLNILADRKFLFTNMFLADEPYSFISKNMRVSLKSKMVYKMQIEILLKAAFVFSFLEKRIL